MDILLSLTGMLAAGLMVVAGVLAVLALRNVGSAVLLAGASLGFLNAVGWQVFSFVQRSGSLEAGAGLLTVMRVLGSSSWLLTAVGVMLLAMAASGLRRRNQALESIMAGSQTDRVA